MTKNHLYVPSIFMEMNSSARGEAPFEKKIDGKGNHYFLRKRSLPDNTLKDVHLSIYEHIDPRRSAFAPLHTTFEFHDGLIIHFYYNGKNTTGKDLTFQLIDARPKRNSQQEAFEKNHIAARIAQYEKISSQEIENFLLEFNGIKKSRLERNETELAKLSLAMEQSTSLDTSVSNTKTRYLKKLGEHIDFCEPFYSQKHLDFLKSHHTDVSSHRVGQMPNTSPKILSVSNICSPSPATGRPPSPATGRPPSPENPLFSSDTALWNAQWGELNKNLLLETPPWTQIQTQFENLQKQCLEIYGLNNFFSLKNWLKETYLEAILNAKYFPGLVWIKDHVDLFDSAQKIFNALSDDPTQLDFILNGLGSQANDVRISCGKKTNIHPLHYFIEKRLPRLFAAWIEKRSEARIFFSSLSYSDFTFIFGTPGEPYVSIIKKLHLDYSKEKEEEILKISQAFDRNNLIYNDPYYLQNKTSLDAKTADFYKSMENLVRTLFKDYAQKLRDEDFSQIADNYWNMVTIYATSRNIFNCLRTSLRNPRDLASPTSSTPEALRRKLKYQLFQTKLKNAAHELLQKLPIITGGPLTMSASLVAPFLEKFPIFALWVLDIPDKIPEN